MDVVAAIIIGLFAPLWLWERRRQEKKRASATT